MEAVKSDEVALEPRKIRPEDVTPSDPGKVYTRLLVNKYDFGKIIGKGGQTITALKSQTGCHVKGINDTDDETRMMVVSGPLPNVIDAFNRLVQLMYETYVTNNSSATSERGAPFGVQVYVDDNKVGRILGVKGAQLQQMRERSGLQHITLNREVKEYAGASLRTISIEGPPYGILRVHEMLLQCCNPSLVPRVAVPANSSSLQVNANPAPFSPVVGYNPSQLGQQGTALATAPSLPSPPATSVRGVNSPMIQMDQLYRYGVDSNTITHIGTLQANLAKFGLDVCVVTQSQPVGGPTLVTSANSTYLQVEYLVPSNHVGGLIGMRGSTLQELQSRTPTVTIHIDRTDVVLPVGTCGEYMYGTCSAAGGAKYKTIQLKGEELSPILQAKGHIQTLLKELERSDPAGGSNGASGAQLAFP